jgi:hypothetical protein
MQTFEVSLYKSYVVKIKAESQAEATEYSELFTTHISDIFESEK